MEKELYALQVKCLELVGFTRWNLMKRPKLTFAFLLLNFASALFCVFTQSAFIIENFSDILLATDAACPLCSVINVSVKFVVFFFAHEEIYALIDEMREMSEEAESSNPEAIGRLKKVEKTIAVLFLISAGATGGFYVILPIIEIFLDVCVKKEGFNYNLPYISSFPYDTTSVQNYVATYFMLYWGTHSTVFLFVGIDSLIFGLCFGLGTHYDILKASCDGDKKKFIQTHQKLINFSKKLSDIIKPIVLCQFSITGFLLCVIGFQVLIDDTISGRLIAVNYALAVTIQLFIYAAGGQILTDKSSSLTEDFYELDKDMIIIIARSQKPSEIDAWFYKANFMNFRRVLSTAGSFITVLKSFID